LITCILAEETDFEIWDLRDLDLDLGSGHTAYCRLSFIDLYIHSLPKSRSNWKNVLWTDGQTYVRTDDRLHSVDST